MFVLNLLHEKSCSENPSILLGHPLLPASARTQTHSAMEERVLSGQKNKESLWVFSQAQSHRSHKKFSRWKGNKNEIVIVLLLKKKSESVSHSVMSDSETPWVVDHQAPLSMEFSRQEYWSGLPFPSPGDLPAPGTEPQSPVLQADSLLSEPQTVCDYYVEKYALKQKNTKVK